MNRITPYTITSAALSANPGLMLQFRDAKIGDASYYEARQPIEITDEQAAGDAEAIGEIAWATYQNLDEDRMCPDDGRSMMVGDLVLVEREGQPDTWVVVAPMGFKDVTDMVKLRNLFSSKLNA